MITVHEGTQTKHPRSALTQWKAIQEEIDTPITPDNLFYLAVDIDTNAISANKDSYFIAYNCKMIMFLKSTIDLEEYCITYNLTGVSILICEITVESFIINKGFYYARWPTKL